MKTAIQAFDEIINDMPESETAFEIAKEALISTLRTQRITGRHILSSYLSTRELGPVKTLTLEEITDPFSLMLCGTYIRDENTLRVSFHIIEISTDK